MKITKIEDLNNLESSLFKIDLGVGTIFVDTKKPAKNVCEIRMDLDLGEIVSLLKVFGFDVDYRPEPKFTEADILFARAYAAAGYGEHWVAKDKCDTVYLYEKIPVRQNVTWFSNFWCDPILPNFFSDMTFENDAIQLKTIAESEAAV